MGAEGSISIGFYEYCGGKKKLVSCDLLIPSSFSFPIVVTRFHFQLYLPPTFRPFFMPHTTTSSFELLPQSMRISMLLLYPFHHEIPPQVHFTLRAGKSAQHHQFCSNRVLHTFYWLQIFSVHLNSAQTTQYIVTNLHFTPTLVFLNAIFHQSLVPSW